MPTSHPEQNTPPFSVGAGRWRKEGAVSGTGQALQGDTISDNPGQVGGEGIYLPLKFFHAASVHSVM